jgi:hypothetical protein
LMDELSEIKNTFIGWKFRPKIPRKLNSHFKRVLSPPSFSIKDLSYLIFDAFHYHSNSFKVVDPIYHYLLCLIPLLIAVINE